MEIESTAMTGGVGEYSTRNQGIARLGRSLREKVRFMWKKTVIGGLVIGIW